MTDTTDLIQRLRTAWTYCGVEQALRFEAAAALEQQAAQIDALRADAERLQALATCGCGDGFTAHDPGTCGNCMAAHDAAPRQEQPT